ncbi:MAG: FtsW/RodA/SpoVE family cell cycle protein [Paludibacteraceae bacterium]|jgi:cell division protein FtsW|nr:FtsW/RodA/SpoVE family cell cycle protein [Paludibacteraceae bacterium]
MTIQDIKQYIHQQMQYVDRTYWMLFTALILMASIALFSASSFFVFQEGGSTLGPILSQMLFIAIGVGLAFVLQFIPSKWIRLLGYVGLIVSISLLLLTFSPLGVEINGSKRWLTIAGITFQPSELAKLTLIIVVSDLLSRIRTVQDQRKYFCISMGITLVICGIIFIGNLSTAVLLGGVIILLTILARVHIKYWGSLVAAMLVFLICGYFFVNEVYVQQGRKMEGVLGRAVTWVGRINDMLEENNTTDAEFRITDDNYQSAHAKIAIARGGKSPFGVLPGNSIQRDVLPQAYADYIFAIIVEEWGIVGAIGLILIYLAILFRACLKSSRYADFSAMLMVMGLALMITCQALVSMMVSVGIGPVTGQPLPMISRGGTSALITSIYFGIIMSVSREQTELGARQQEAINQSLDDVPDIQLD